jgi:acyl carrier protein
MNRNDLIALIEQTVVDMSPTKPAGLGENTVLFGDDGLFDSLGLVTLTLSVEAQVNETLGTAIALTDDRALLRAQSPFSTVASLADYVVELLAGARSA